VVVQVATRSRGTTAGYRVAIAQSNFGGGGRGEHSHLRQQQSERGNGAERRGVRRHFPRGPAGGGHTQCHDHGLWLTDLPAGRGQRLTQLRGGGTIAASGSRVATVAVTATIVGSKVNTTGSVTSTNGGAGNSGSATLTAVDANIQLTPASAGNPAGTNHVLTITVNALGGTIDAGSHTATASIVSGPGSSRRPPPTGSVSRTRS
jgi:hypothetical protein